MFVAYFARFEGKRDINSRINFVYHLRGSTLMDVLKSWLRVALVALLGTFIAIGCADTGGGGGDAAAPAEETEPVAATELVAAEGGEEAAAEAGEEPMTELEPAEDAAAEDGGEGDAEPMTELEPAEEAAADEGAGEAAAEEAPAE